MKHDRRYQDKEWLEIEYIKKGRTTKDIAKECGVDISTLGMRAVKYNLTKRKKNPDSKSDYKNKKWLYEQYVIKNKTRRDIATEQGRHIKTIIRYLSNFKIYKNL